MNERPTIELEHYPYFANNWSVLRFDDASKSTTKFQALVDTLSKNTSLCSLVKKVHCTWHLNHNLLIPFTKLMCQHGSNVTHFENFLHIEILGLLAKSLNKQLQSLDIVPHAKLPGTAYASYLPTITSLADKFNWSNINSLTIYVDVLMWFPNFVNLRDKLKVTELCLNLRNDTFPQSGGLQKRATFTDIFDTNLLTRLSILSWYETETINVYERFGLFDLVHFKNIKELSLLSMFYNEQFMISISRNLAKLERLKLDFMFDHEISRAAISSLSQNCKLKYLDCKFEDIEESILHVVELDNFAIFEISQTCLCEHCVMVYNSIILKKYFPNKNAFIIQNANDIHSRHFLNHMFKLYPITPYFHFINTTPCIAYRSRSIGELARKTNELLNDVFYDFDYDTSDTKVTTEDIISLYQCICHSMKRTFDFFLNQFPRLQILVLNDLPTVIKEQDSQRYMEPIFFSKGYKTNQIYELVNDESLFQ